MASASVFAFDVANDIVGVDRPGTLITARSRSGSNSTTVPGCCSPSSVCTVRVRVPATTCAFVSTRPGANAKPEPSIRRSHDGALPSIFTTDRCDATTIADVRE